MLAGAEDRRGGEEGLKERQSAARGRGKSADDDLDEMRAALFGDVPPAADALAER